MKQPISINTREAQPELIFLTNCSQGTLETLKAEIQLILQQRGELPYVFYIGEPEATLETAQTIQKRLGVLGLYREARPGEDVTRLNGRMPKANPRPIPTIPTDVEELQPLSKPVFGRPELSCPDCAKARRSANVDATDRSGFVHPTCPKHRR